MSAIGIVLVCLGIIGLIYGILQRMKAGRVTDAPLVSTGDAAARGQQLAGPKGQISAQGGVMCQQPVYAPVTGTPSLFYELKVTAEWKEGDSTKTKEIEHQKVAAQICINDGSGPVWVDLREGGDFEPTTKKEMEQSTGLLKGITGGAITFGNYQLNAGMFSLGTTYKVVETALPVQQSLYVCGRMAEQGGVITAPKWRNLIVSNLNRDQLLAAATKSAKIALIVGAAMFVVGGALAGIGAAMSGDDSNEASAEPTASASAETAPDPAATDEPSAEPTDEPAASGAPAVNKPTTPTKAAAPSTAATTSTSTGQAAATTSATAPATRPTATTSSTAPATRPTGTTTKRPSIIIKPRK